jgi:hypothetical protein
VDLCLVKQRLLKPNIAIFRYVQLCTVCLIDLLCKIIKVDGVKLVETQHLILLTTKAIRYLIVLHALRFNYVVENVMHRVV